MRRRMHAEAFNLPTAERWPRRAQAFKPTSTRQHLLSACSSVAGRLLTQLPPPLATGGSQFAPGTHCLRARTPARPTGTFRRSPHNPSHGKAGARHACGVARRHR